MKRLHKGISLIEFLVMLTMVAIGFTITFCYKSDVEKGLVPVNKPYSKATSAEREEIIKSNFSNNFGQYFVELKIEEITEWISYNKDKKIVTIVSISKTIGNNNPTTHFLIVYSKN
jgi:uncharacterized protein (UPF0333 family)